MKPITTPTLVMKFGGTSVGSVAAIENVCHIVQDVRGNWPHLVIVVSAMSGVTNLLLETAERAARGDDRFIDEAVERIRQRHQEVSLEMLPAGIERHNFSAELEDLLLEFAQLCKAIAVLGEATPRALDTVAAFGERLNARQVSAILRERGYPADWVDATELLVTDARFQAAHPDMELTAKKSRRLLDELWINERIPVVTGFIGATPDGQLTTLGRGGSDYSAAILGAALPADAVWIWTDVDGVMSADPRLVPDAHTISELSYREIAELAYYGAKVLHPKAIRPVIEANIELRVLNTFNPRHAGTRLVADSQKISQNGLIKAVTAVGKLGLITIEGRGMLGVPGVAARTFGAVAATGTSVPLITQASSEQSICFAIPFESIREVQTALETAFSQEISRRDIDRISVNAPVTIITAVGAGMQHTPGVAGKLFGALGDAGINVIAIAQGSSEVAISLVVAAEQAEVGVRTIHALTLERRKLDQTES